MLTEKQVDAAYKLTGAEYREFFALMDKKVQEQLVKDWGEAPGTVMEYDGDILVPGTMNGNVFVTVQPPRGFGEDPEKFTTILTLHRRINILPSTVGYAMFGRQTLLRISVRMAAWNGFRARTPALIAAATRIWRWEICRIFILITSLLPVRAFRQNAVALPA